MLMVNVDAVVVVAGLLDEVIQVASADAIAFARQLAIKEVRAHPFIAENMRWRVLLWFGVGSGRLLRYFLGCGCESGGRAVQEAGK